MRTVSFTVSLEPNHLIVGRMSKIWWQTIRIKQQLQSDYKQFPSKPWNRKMNFILKSRYFLMNYVYSTRRISSKSFNHNHHQLLQNKAYRKYCISSLFPDMILIWSALIVMGPEQSLKNVALFVAPTWERTQSEAENEVQVSLTDQINKRSQECWIKS